MLTATELMVDGSVTPRSTYLSSLLRQADPPRHPRSFRPNEVLRDLYIGGLRDCKGISALYTATGARLIVRACAVGKEAPFTVHNLRVPRKPPHRRTNGTEEAGAGTRVGVAVDAEGNVVAAPSTAVNEPPAKAVVPFHELEPFLQCLLRVFEAEAQRDAAADLETTRDSIAFTTRAVGVIVLHKADDVPTYNMAQHFPDTCRAISAVWAACRRPVVVHCAAGVSRSVSIVLAFLARHCEALCDPGDSEHPFAKLCPDIAKKPPSVAELLRAVQARRPVACPNEGFMAQLEAWAAATASVPGAATADA